MYPMENNSLTKPVITSSDSDDEHIIPQLMEGYRKSAEPRFPIQPTPITVNFGTFPQYKEGTSIPRIPNDCEEIRRKQHKLIHFTKMLKDLCVQESIEIDKKLENHGASFPFMKLTTNTKNTFPIRYNHESRGELRFLPSISAETESLCINGDVRFPLVCTTEKLKLDILQYAGSEESLVHFPLKKVSIKRQTSKQKDNDELVSPIKTEIFSNINSTTITKCYNHSTDNNTSSSTMTPSRNLADKSLCGGMLVDANNVIKTNLERCEHEKTEQEQEHPTHTCLLNENDDMLAIGEAKNIFDSGQPKNCDELRHITEIQNSSSTSGTWHSHKNMNDLQKRHQKQQIKDIQPTTKTSTELNNEMQSNDQIVHFTSYTNINIPTRNNLSVIHFENKQEPRSTYEYFAHSEVRDPSSEEVLIVDNRVACKNHCERIRAASVPPRTVKSSYVNESTSLTSLTLTPSTTLSFAEAPHVQNNISTEIDGKGGDTSTNLCLFTEANVFVEGDDNAMTLTKVAELNKEDNISVSSSKVDDNQYLVCVEGFQTGMKFDMNNSKLVSDVRTLPVASNIRGKSEPRQIMAVSGSNVLAAATDLSKLANFGKTRRESSLLSHTGSVTSLDAKDSVLPTRTLLRRQRRLQPQGSEDKQEDPVERLNRLRARISGALTEVKGVLKHYSVDETAEINQTPALTNAVGSVDRIKANEQKNAAAQSGDDGPVSFRFVKKVRRRSVFTDDDADKITKELPVENAESKPPAKSEVNKANNITAKVEEDVAESSKDHSTNLTEIGCLSQKDRVIDNVEPKRQELIKENAESQPLAKDEVTKGYTIIGKGAEGVRECSKNDSTNPSESGYLREKIHVIDNVEPKSQEVAKENAKSDVQNNIANPDVPLCNETPRESSSVVIEPQETGSVPKEEDKRQHTVKTKKCGRRASIALVEGSQIDPAVNTLIPHNIKTQRRPSDSETLIKQKTEFTEANSNASIKKVRTVVKVKRPSVKSNADVTTKNKTTSSTEINQPDNNIKDDTSSALEASDAITSVDAVTAKTAITAMVPKTSEILSSQLAITIAINDASSFSSAEKPTDESAEATQPLSIVTNSSRTPAKLVDQNGEIDAPLVSPLRTGESSSHTIKPEAQTLSLLVNNSNIDTAIELTPKDPPTNEEHLNVNVSTQTQISKSEQLTNLKAQPATPTDCVDHQKLDTKSLENFNNTNKDSETLLILPSVPDSNVSETIKADSNLSGTRKSLDQQTDKPTSHSTKICQSNDRMPEQQVAPTPVKPEQVFADNDKSKAKKTIIKRIVRKNSVDKAIDKKKPINSAPITVDVKVDKDEELITDSESTSNSVTTKSESTEEDIKVCNEVATPEESLLEEPVETAKPKKPRKVKKKVIIKRQHRKLSVGENTFFKESEQPDASSTATETLERAIAYVTDEEDETSEPYTVAEPMMPIKSCIKQREFQVGDFVMYGERYRKTQIRWRKGQITERITSISYKINIDGTEVSAHISYIKKYTDRKVNFGGKEYLEIDYEQIAEEERRARTYSIWNMV